MWAVVFPEPFKIPKIPTTWHRYFHLIVEEFFHSSKNLFDDLVKVHYYTNEYLLMPITGKFSHALPAWSSKEFYYEFFINGCDNNLCERLLFPSSIIYWSKINSQQAVLTNYIWVLSTSFLWSKWNLYLQITIFVLKMTVKRSLEKYILKSLHAGSRKKFVCIT